MITSVRLIIRPEAPDKHCAEGTAREESRRSPTRVQPEAVAVKTIASRPSTCRFQSACSAEGSVRSAPDSVPHVNVVKRQPCFVHSADVNRQALAIFGSHK